MSFVYAAFDDVNNPSVEWEWTGGSVPPFATVVLTFNHLLNISEIGDIEYNWRVTRNGAYLPHLHQKFTNLPARALNGTFFWRVVGGKSVLWYRPHGLWEHSNYEVGLYPFYNYYQWTMTNSNTGNNRLRFSVSGFGGTDIRVYDVAVPALADFLNIIRHEDLGEESDPPFVPTNLHDQKNDRTYADAEIRIRGRSSLAHRKKSFTIGFSELNLFAGFKDRDGTAFEGPRSRLRLVGQHDLLIWTMITNRASYDINRKIEERIYGAGLAPDSYFAHVVINGYYWGVYLLGETFETGDGGWSETNSRDPLFKKDTVMHKILEGCFEAVDGWNFEPRTEHELDFPESVLDPSRMMFDIAMPYSIAFKGFVPGQCSGDPFQDELDLEIKATYVQGAADKRMKLVASLGTYNQANKSVGLVVEGSNAIVGTAFDLHLESPRLTGTFPFAVKAGEGVEVEFHTLHDMKVADPAIQADPFSWFETKSAMQYLFYWRFSRNVDISRQNFYLFLNCEADGLSDFSNPSGLCREAKYVLLADDVDNSFLNSTLSETSLGIENAQLLFNRLKSLPGAEQDYVNLLAPELQANGVLTTGFYDGRFAAYAQELTDSVFEFNRRRWPQQAYSVAQMNTLKQSRFIQTTQNQNFRENYLLDLNRIAPFVPPDMQFVRGDVDRNGALAMTDAIIILNRVDGGRQADTCDADVCDVNDDGESTSEDAIYLLDYLFHGSGAPPLPPFPASGLDPTADHLAWPW